MEMERFNRRRVLAAQDELAAEGAQLKMIEEGFGLILDGLGYEWRELPHMRDTPKRAARAWFYELCEGSTRVEPSITVFPHTGDTGMIILREIPVRSLCSHHLLPFIGTATVGYVGDSQLLGLSKLSRIVNHQARRPQVQEVLTTAIADAIHAKVMTDAERKGQGTKSGAAVVIRARHMCMELRGVNHSGLMVTSAIRGVFEDSEVRAEFLTLAGER